MVLWCSQLLFALLSFCPLFKNYINGYCIFPEVLFHIELDSADIFLPLSLWRVYFLFFFHSFEKKYMRRTDIFMIVQMEISSKNDKQNRNDSSKNLVCYVCMLCSCPQIMAIILHFNPLGMRIHHKT